MPFDQLALGASRIIRAHPVDQNGGAQEVTDPAWSTTGQIPISSISVANPATITTAVAHGLTTGQGVGFTGSEVSSNPYLTGWFPVTVTGTHAFTIPVDVTFIPPGAALGTVHKIVMLRPVPPSFLTCVVTPVWPGSTTIHFEALTPHDPAPAGGGPELVEVDQPVTVIANTRVAFFRYPRTPGDAEITTLTIDDGDPSPQIVAVPVNVLGQAGADPVSNGEWLNEDGDDYIQIDNTMTSEGPQTVILRSPRNATLITVNVTNALNQVITGNLTVKTLAVTAVSLSLSPEIIEHIKPIK